MKTVILPTDFSDNAWKANCYAAQLYHEQPVNYHLLHTVLVPYSQLESGLMQDVSGILTAAEQEMEIWQTRFKELDHHSQSQFTTHCRFASLADAVTDLEENIGGEITIVMGTQGVTGIGEVFLGTMSSHIVTHAKSNVLVVPNGAQLNPPKKIMFAIDNHGISKKEEVKHLLEIAQEHNAFLNVVNVPTGDSNNILEFGGVEQTALTEFFKGINHAYHSLGGAYKEDELLHFAASNHIDLMVMIKRKRGFWQNLFHHSLTKSMVFRSDVPILILKE